MELELRLSVEDSPNSAGIVIDAIRCCKLALDRGEAGVLFPVAAYFMKHPPRQYTDDEAFHMTEAFIQGLSGKKPVGADRPRPIETGTAETKGEAYPIGRVDRDQSPWDT